MSRLLSRCARSAAHKEYAKYQSYFDKSHSSVRVLVEPSAISTAASTAITDFGLAPPSGGTVGVKTSSLPPHYPMVFCTLQQRVPRQAKTQPTEKSKKLVTPISYGKHPLRTPKRSIFNLSRSTAVRIDLQRYVLVLLFVQHRRHATHPVHFVSARLAWHWYINIANHLGHSTF